VTTLPPIALIELASRIKAIREDQHRLPELEARLDMLLHARKRRKRSDHGHISSVMRVQ